MAIVIGSPWQAGHGRKGSPPLTRDLFHYARVSPAVDGVGNDLLIVGGEDHKAAHETDGDRRWNNFDAWAGRHFAGITQPSRRWSGQVMASIDGLGFIGRNPGDTPNIFFCTGDTGMGMTGGALAGMIIRDLMLDQPSPFATVFDPSRKPVTGFATFIKELGDVAAQYVEWVTPGEVDDIAEIKAGSAAIYRRGARKFAVSRDKDGVVTCLSAVCTHLGCLVAWNPSGSTWDCPCHGSRFRPDGSVILGPASAPLDTVPLDDLQGEAATSGPAREQQGDVPS